MATPDKSEEVDKREDYPDTSTSLLSLDQIRERVLRGVYGSAERSFTVATAMYTPEKLVQEATDLSEQAVSKKRTREAESVGELLEKVRTEVLEFIEKTSGSSAKGIEKSRAAFRTILLSLSCESKKASALPITASEMEGGGICLPPQFLKLLQYCIDCDRVCAKIVDLKKVHAAGNLFPGWQSRHYPKAASSALDCIGRKLLNVKITRQEGEIYCPNEFLTRAPDIVRAMLSQYGITEQELREIVSAFSAPEFRRRLGPKN